jgi:hypothetical protein
LGCDRVSFLIVTNTLHFGHRQDVTPSASMFHN